MAVPVAVPDLGDQDFGGLVAEWYHPDGATVDVGEVVVRVESAFVSFEIEAEGPGLLHHRLPVGSIERPGAVLGVILAPDEAMPPEGSFFRPPESRVIPVQFPAATESPDVEETAVPRLPEFEEALVEAVVVPFPGKFAGTTGRAWDEAPGDAIEFDSGLFGESEQDRIDALNEPGGTIPGLPLWDPEEGIGVRMAPRPATTERFARISDEASASAQVLTMTMTVNLIEAERMRSAFEREWHPHGPAPMLEDVVFRALAWAIEGTAFAGGTGAMFVATTDSDLAFAVSKPAARTFREAVSVRAADGDAAFESAHWLLVSLASLGVSSASPRLASGMPMSFALAAKDETHRASLKMAYDSARWSEGSAARLLARVREILELPYAMLT